MTRRGECLTNRVLPSFTYIKTGVIEAIIAIVHAYFPFFVPSMTTQEVCCIKFGVLGALSIDKPCYVCWYDFEATNEEKATVQNSNYFVKNLFIFGTKD
jgi:hypothetical protein